MAEPSRSAEPDGRRRRQRRQWRQWRQRQRDGQRAYTIPAPRLQAVGWAGAAAWRQDQAQTPLGKPLVGKDKLKRNLVGAIRPSSTGLRRGPSFASASPLEMPRGYLAKREGEASILGLGDPEYLCEV